ncbi:hypothetical protein [Sneathiella glossodoripedis]|uniref:hypothetical protein n=1 Tax=Sneathiella glossodoripedis TaxID=418853 RepID=UPI00046F4819|nr:hypothetical protein [Sneathiella glossodoripedis]
MASTFTSTAAAATAPVYQPMGDGVACAKATYELTAALVVDDIIQMVRLPKNAVVLDVVLVTDDLDSNGTPTYARCGLWRG